MQISLNSQLSVSSPITLVLNQLHFTALSAHDPNYKFKTCSEPENQYEKFQLEFD